MNKAKKLLLASFLACMVLGTGSALTACGGTTSSGGGTSTPDSSTSTPEAWELENATVSYTVDKNGVETANYVVTGKNGEEYTKSVPTGRTVVGVTHEVRVNGEEVDADVLETAVGEELKVELGVIFNDETTGWVVVTDDMYIKKPDYTKAGLYTAEFKLVERFSAPVVVIGEEPVNVQAMFLNQDMGGMCVLWDKADVVAGTYDVSTVFWAYYTYDGENENQVIVNATPEQIKPIDWTAESEEGVYNFSVTNENGDSGILQAYVLDEASETAVVVAGRQLGSFSMMSSLTAVKGSSVSAIDTSDMLVAEMLMIGDGAAMAMRMAELPETAEFTLDTTTTGWNELIATWTVGEGDDAEEVEATTSVIVYENKVEVGAIEEMNVISYKVVESGLPAIEFYIYTATEYTAGTGDDEQVLTTENENWECVALTADMIKGTAPDFTTAGVKVFTVEVNGNEYTYAIELWAEEEKAVASTTNIANISFEAIEEEYVSFDGNEMYIVKDSVNFEVFVRKNFVGGEYMVSYIEAVNGSYDDYVVLKASAFDWSAVKMDTVGEYAFKVSYEGFEKTITVNVVEELPEVETATLVAQLQNDGTVQMSALNSNLLGIMLYDDNTAEIMDGWSIMWYESVWATYTLDEATGKLELSVDGAKFAIATVVDTDEDEIYDQITAYAFGEPTAEYTIIYFGEEQTLKLYEEGYGECVSEWGYATFSGAYTLKDGLLTIGDNKFYIQGTGADAKVIEVMSGEY